MNNSKLNICFYHFQMKYSITSNPLDIHLVAVKHINTIIIINNNILKGEIFYLYDSIIFTKGGVVYLFIFNDE